MISALKLPSGVLPAYAGMIPCAAPVAHRKSSAPRLRGDDPYTSPYDKRGYGVVTEVLEMETVTEKQQAAAAAARAMSDALIASETRSVELVPDPTIRGGDVHGFITESGEIFMGRVIAYSLPLDDVSANMRVDVEVLQW